MYNVSSSGHEINSIVKEGCKHYVFPLIRRITPLTDIFALIKLYKFIKNEKFDIVHSHTQAGIIAMLASYLALGSNKIAHSTWTSFHGVKWLEENIIN